ncbi:hypothetical protein FB467_0048 [Ornithinicoccus hortensis]|uniref:Uncharacterized protein n=1 Tax=Ornithinicoccus hortensis TaxID=82346 RepID=A0A542YLL4_9MICO|nr:hypothetical protein FB467_0048 [Ornithinicoccus hortensis]
MACASAQQQLRLRKSLDAVESPEDFDAVDVLTQEAFVVVEEAYHPVTVRRTNDSERLASQTTRRKDQKISHADNLRSGAH